MMKIREATLDDFPTIWNIFHEVVKEGDTYVFDPSTSYEEAKEIWMGQGVATYVAEYDTEKIVGTYILKRNQPGLGSHVVNASFMVHPQYHGRGVGRQMGDDALSRAKEQGYLAMQFNIVVATNKAAINLWKKMGFEIIGTIPKAFNHKKSGLVDAYVMHRFLEDH